ncbi:MAG: hypothetical protein ACR2MX_04480 [Cyclobacteriaceae bacterium]
MKAASVREIKQELSNRSADELLELCLRLSKFKKENKELLTYLLYEASNEAAYVENIKDEMALEFERINRKSYYFIKKSVRKILRNVKKYIRYSKKKETEVELLIYFCSELKRMSPSMEQNTTLHNIFQRQIRSVSKTISYLHEDLRYDYEMELNALS